MSNKRRIFLSLLAAAAVCLGGCQQSDEGQKVELLDPVGCEEGTYIVEYHDVDAFYCNTDAQVVPASEAVYLENGGYVGNFKVAIGDTVKKGQLICESDSSMLTNQYESLQQQISQTKTDHQYTVDQLTCDIEIEKLRLTALQKQEQPDENQIAAQKLAVKEAELMLNQENDNYSLNLKLLNNQLAEYEQQMEEQRLYAPMDGVISYLPDTTLSRVYLSPEQPAAIISDSSRFRLRVDYMSDGKIQKVYKRFTACVNGTEYPLTVCQPSYEEYQIAAKQNRKVYTEFEFTGGAPKGITSGTPMSLYMYYGEYEHVLAVPYHALKSDGDQFRLDIMRDGRRYMQDVKVEQFTVTEAVISEGLQEGDVVYVD